MHGNSVVSQTPLKWLIVFCRGHPNPQQVSVISAIGIRQKLPEKNIVQMKKLRLSCSQGKT